MSAVADVKCVGMTSKHPYIDSDLIKLYHETTYMWYDGPMLYSAKDEKGNLYLVHKADEHDWESGEEGVISGQDDWLVIPISPARLQQFANSEIDMHDTFRYAEGGKGIYVESRWPLKAGGDDRAKWVELDQLEEDLFCKKGVFLNPKKDI